jgi:hypothetical protein
MGDFVQELDEYEHGQPKSLISQTSRKISSKFKHTLGEETFQQRRLRNILDCTKKSRSKLERKSFIKNDHVSLMSDRTSF